VGLNMNPQNGIASLNREKTRKKRDFF